MLVFCLKASLGTCLSELDHRLKAEGKFTARVSDFRALYRRPYGSPLGMAAAAAKKPGIGPLLAHGVVVVLYGQEFGLGRASVHAFRSLLTEALSLQAT